MHPITGAVEEDRSGRTKPATACAQVPHYALPCVSRQPKRLQVVDLTSVRTSNDARNLGVTCTVENRGTRGSLRELRGPSGGTDVRAVSSFIHRFSVRT